MYPFSSRRAENPESMMADEHVATGDENKTTTVWNDADDDQSGSNLIFPNDESNYYYYIYKYINIYIYIYIYL